MHPLTVIQHLVALARPIILTQYDPDSCIGSTRIGIDVLAHFGIEAHPEPTRAFVANKHLLRRLQREGGKFTPPFRGNEWSVGVGWPPTTPPKKPGYNGHLVIIVPYNGREVLIDLTLDQAYRPAKGIHAKPFVATMPEDWRTNHQYFDHGSWGVGYMPHTPPIDYRVSPNWTSEGTNKLLTGLIIAAILNHETRTTPEGVPD